MQDKQTALACSCQCNVSPPEYMASPGSESSSVHLPHGVCLMATKRNRIVPFVSHMWLKLRYCLVIPPVVLCEDCR